jgi:hypothetical protein
LDLDFIPCIPFIPVNSVLNFYNDPLCGPGIRRGPGIGRSLKRLDSGFQRGTPMRKLYE